MTHMIASGRVYLRPFEPSDAELYRRWRADADPMSLAGWHHRAPMSLAEVEHRISKFVTDPSDDFVTFLICLVEDDRPIGEAMLGSIDRRNGSAELGIFIGESGEWGKGYGTDAVNAITDFGFAELRLERIWLNVWTENPRAQRAYEKAGFRHEGSLRDAAFVHGGRDDQLVMGLLAGELIEEEEAPQR